MDAKIDLNKMTKDVIKGEVIKRSLKSLMTVVPFLLGLMSIAAWAILDMGLLYAGAGAFALLLSVAGFVWNYTQRYYKYQNDYLEELHWEVDFENQWKLEEFKEIFEESDIEQAYDQVNLIKAKADAFYDVLNQRFEEGELTFSRYRSVVDQTYTSTIYNLNEICIKLKAIDGIDIDRLNDQINSTYEDGQLEQLNERVSIYEGAHSEIKKLLILNEKALTELDKFTVMVSNANVDRFDPEEELMSALDRISGMTDQPIVSDFDDQDEGFEGLDVAIDALANAQEESVGYQSSDDNDSMGYTAPLSEMDYNEKNYEPAIVREEISVYDEPSSTSYESSYDYSDYSDDD